MISDPDCGTGEAGEGRCCSHVPSTNDKVAVISLHLHHQLHFFRARLSHRESCQLQAQGRWKLLRNGHQAGGEGRASGLEGRTGITVTGTTRVQFGLHWLAI